jgi:hypothetical protein
MADKGIENKRAGSINFTLEGKDAKGEPLGDINLRPGFNRLSAEQWEALQRNQFFVLYSKTSIREETILENDPEGNQVAKKIKITEPNVLVPFDFPEEEADAKAKAAAEAKAKADAEAAAKAEADAKAKASK